MLALESAATMTPLSKMKASVVVPFLFFTIFLVSAWNPSNCAGDKRETKVQNERIWQIADPFAEEIKE